MPEALTPEIAHNVVHHHREQAGTLAKHEELVEILEAICLAIVAVATAWSGYQTARWDGKQAHEYGISSKEHVLSNRAATRAGQLQLYDTSTMSFWLQSVATHDRAAAQLFERRFRAEFRPAFTAWLATHPFRNSSAPAGPTRMPQYHLAAARFAVVHDRRAAVAFEEGTHARETGDRYLRNTVLLAVVLFLTALAQRFKIMGVRLSLLGLSVILLSIGVYVVATLPST